jgi:alpha-tubulin suppressor-like RCC1 family protein
MGTYIWKTMRNANGQPMAERFTSISVGFDHACGITTSGGVMCWGAGDSGQLGAEGSAGNAQYPPLNVTDLDSGVIAVSAGTAHSCALMVTGGVKCWGNNEVGQLGNGEVTNSSVPVDVQGLSSGVKAISTYHAHTCATLESGGVKCWGYGEHGQLGNGFMKDSRTPVDVVGISGSVSAITLGWGHTCAVTEIGVMCWGYNIDGQLGNGSRVAQSIPVAVRGLSNGVLSISAGSAHSCAVKSDGVAVCWGFNGDNQLGDGTEVERTIPVSVIDVGVSFASIATGDRHTCAVTDDGKVYCWGDDEVDQLGAVSYQYKPVDVLGLNSVATAVSAGASHTCALTNNGIAKCWGGNDNSQTGSLMDTIVDFPRNVDGLLMGNKAVMAGGYHTCAITSGGGMKCVGYGAAVGYGEYWSLSAARDVVGLGSGVKAMALGEHHSCALMAWGMVKCWGDNESGQLGDGTTEEKYSPVNVSGLESGVAAIAAGGNHTCALMEIGGVKCWGENKEGQLGNGSTSNSNTPVDVVKLDATVVAIAAGDEMTCAMTDNGGVKCWGHHYRGIGSDSSKSPFDMHTPAGVLGISTGANHICILTQSGGVQCWGNNMYGQVGVLDGVGNQVGVVKIPTDVLGLSEGVLAISAGGKHTCALMEDGGIKCWGDNGNSQLGDGARAELRYSYSSKPVYVGWVTGYE